ncbi:MAG: cytochrome c peroxidase [Bacteroidota bacterium]
MKYLKHKLILFFLLLLIFSSCKKEKLIQISSNATPYQLVIPQGFPTKYYNPADNPLTVEGIELGRLLFYDGRLAGRTDLDSLTSCATCHKQSKAFECGYHPSGITGIKTPHVMLPLINLIWNPNTLLWNGKVANIEDLFWMGIYAPHEMKSDTNRAKAMIQSIPMYPPLFKKAFGSEIVTAKNMGKAIAQFIRILISSNSKFDKYLKGEANLSAQELNGFVLFTTENGGDCFHCHGGEGNPLFTTNQFYNNGKDTVFTDTRDRYAVTHNPKDIGAYKATTLRNIELTGPYMHDGRFQTLNDVLNFYATGLFYSPSVSSLMHHVSNNGNQLTLSQQQDLLSFLKTLTDSVFTHNPDFSNPRPNDPYFINE